MIPFTEYELGSGLVLAHTRSGLDPVREFGQWTNSSGGWPLLGHTHRRRKDGWLGFSRDSAQGHNGNRKIHFNFSNLL
jgi:hypothetical protein